VATRQAAASYRRARPFDAPTADSAAAEAWAEDARPAARHDPIASARRQATVEDLASVWQRRCHELDRWWVKCGDTAVPVRQFAADCNARAGLALRGDRGQAAVAQLITVYRAQALRIVAWCQESHRQPPRFHNWRTDGTD